MATFLPFYSLYFIMITTTIKNRIDEDICLMLNFSNHSYNYLCDCGIASDLTVKDCRDTAAIFVSHTHIDHFINFNGIVRHQLAIGRRVVVCGGRSIAKNVQCQLLSFSWDLLAYDEKAVEYEVREISDTGAVDYYLLQTPKWELQHLRREEQVERIYENEFFFVRFALLDHGIKTVAYCFEEQPRTKLDTQALGYKAGAWVRDLLAAYEAGDEAAIINVHGQEVAAGEMFGALERKRGFSTVYVIDHAATEANFERIRQLCAGGVDELFIECYYAADDWEFAQKNNHSIAPLSGKIAREVGAKKATPVHFSRRYHEEEERARIMAEFFTAFEGG